MKLLDIDHKYEKNLKNIKDKYLYYEMILLQVEHDKYVEMARYSY